MVVGPNTPDQCGQNPGMLIERKGGGGGGGGGEDSSTSYEKYMYECFVYSHENFVFNLWIVKLYILKLHRKTIPLLHFFFLLGMAVGS